MMDTRGQEVSILLNAVNLILMAQLIYWLQQNLQNLMAQHASMVQELKLKPIGSGTFTASDKEDVVIEYGEKEPFRVQGWIDLRNMADGDTVIMRQYFQLEKEDALSLFAQRTYKNAQSQPLIHITPREIVRKVKVTIQQTSGTFKQFPYEFYVGKTS